jgi:hypothetical protein
LAGLSAAVTEAEARAVLAAFDGLGGVERWIAAQRPWQATASGWTVPGELQGWRFRVEPAPGGVRVIASAFGGEPAVWWVPR